MNYSIQMENFFIFLQTFTWLTIQNIIHYFQNIDYQGIGLHLLTFYSETVQYCKSGFDNVYSIPSVKSRVDDLVYSAQYLKCTLIGQRIEPFNSNWISSSALKTSSMYDNKVMELYYDLDNEELEQNNRNQYVNSAFDIACSGLNSIIKLDSKLNHSMVIMKLGVQYYTRTFNMNTYIEPFDIEKSGVFTNKFLSIEYTHPEMSEGIVVNLDKGYWNIGNHILSNLFIKRWLEYQMLGYRYDNRYIIKILDGDVNVVELTWGKEVVLDEEGSYKING